MDAYLTLQTYNANLFLVGVPPQTGPRNVDVPANNRKGTSKNSSFSGVVDLESG